MVWCVENEFRDDLTLLHSSICHWKRFQVIWTNFGGLSRNRDSLTSFILHAFECILWLSAIVWAYLSSCNSIGTVFTEETIRFGKLLTKTQMMMVNDLNVHQIAWNLIFGLCIACLSYLASQNISLRRVSRNRDSLTSNIRVYFDITSY